ncbi:cell wall hydrolase [Aurantiacibacter gangjinensis]|uniref:cell wall hydrolase n=1 Tax=Aurantiacibacter gangjinensis TaxID=502682 RepID=UPI001F35FD32|nr:cell wall hydrolase [Aurantiacibacter gangjinensis]
MRRVLLGGALIAAPVIAAETALQPVIEQAPAQAIEPMPFETAGGNFPGSAFYYLEDTPPALGISSGDISQPDTAELALLESPELGSVAASFVARGSDRDVARAQECLTMAIYYEAASESDAGQRAVAQVVLNRVAHSAWPSTVCGVVYQGSTRQTGCQFTFTCDGSLARRPSRGGWERAGRIARSALAGSVYAPVGLSTHYHTLAVSPYWAPSLARTTVIGAHIFYRLPGVAGSAGAFDTAYRGGEPAAASARSASIAAPDPVAMAEADTLAEVPGIAAPPPPSAAPSAAPVQDRLPQSGDVREEYRNAGRWIERD